MSLTNERKPGRWAVMTTFYDRDGRLLLPHVGWYYIIRPPGNQQESDSDKEKPPSVSAV